MKRIFFGLAAISVVFMAASAAHANGGRKSVCTSKPVAPACVKPYCKDKCSWKGTYGCNPCYRPCYPCYRYCYSYPVYCNPCWPVVFQCDVLYPPPNAGITVNQTMVPPGVGFGGGVGQPVPGGPMGQ